MEFDKNTEARLQQYVELLLEWNKSINLISRTTEDDIWNRHILDSAQLIDFLDPEEIIYDIGSGAGLPGIILSICGIKEIYLVESKAKKCKFLAEAAKISGNKIIILNDRIENVKPTIRTNPSRIVSRALASVDNLLSFNINLNPKDGFLLLKGENFEKELEEARLNWHFEVMLHSSKTNEKSQILEIKNVRKKD